MSSGDRTQVIALTWLTSTSLTGLYPSPECILIERLHNLLLYSIDKNTGENNVKEEGPFLVHSFRGSVTAWLCEFGQSIMAAGVWQSSFSSGQQEAERAWKPREQGITFKGIPSDPFSPHLNLPQPLKIAPQAVNQAPNMLHIPTVRAAAFARHS